MWEFDTISKGGCVISCEGSQVRQLTFGVRDLLKAPKMGFVNCTPFRKKNELYFIVFFSVPFSKDPNVWPYRYRLFLKGLTVSYLFWLSCYSNCSAKVIPADWQNLFLRMRKTFGFVLVIHIIFRPRNTEMSAYVGACISLTPSTIFTETNLLAGSC